MRTRDPARRATLGAATLSVLALALSPACSKSDSDKKEKEGEAASKREATPRRGGHIKLPSNEPRYLNPILETRFDRANQLIFEGLVGLGPKLEEVPRLAKSWDVSDDGKTITFHLRKGVSWHDGQPFTSRDVKFTFEAIRDTGAQTVWKGYMASVAEVKTPDDRTVVVEYDEPYAPALKTWTIAILPAHIYGDGDIADSEANTEPVGTGPYRLARWESGERMLLEANETWWHGRPNIDSIELVFSAADQVKALADREVDFADVSDIDAWRQTQMPDFRERFEVSDVAEARFRAIAWNTQREPFDDPKVRVGLTHALDRERVVSGVLLGQAQPLSAPFFPNMFGLDPSIAPYPFDVDRAVELLNEAGHPAKDGERFDVELIMLASQSGPTADQTLAIFRRDLGAIGVELRVNQLPTREFFERIVLREFDAVYFGWLPDIPDPDPYALLHSSQIGSGANFAGLADTEVDRLLEEARRETNRQERKAIYHEAHARLHELEPYTVLYAPFGHYAWSRRLRRVNPADIGPQPRFPGIARWFVAPVDETARAGSP